MKKSLLFLISFGITFALFTSCEEKKDEDVCQRFNQITNINPTCDIPSICCPVEENENCYIQNTSGKKYYCNASQSSDTNPNGCNIAQEQYIAENCQTSKMTSEQIAKIKAEFDQITFELLQKVRTLSLICQ
ncbi:MAG TPA: hypothetical protein PK990_07510 [Salinivirgaceae bacterium]|nr:hypothetical protein [Salinivirgaceae bacterium]